MSSRTSLPSTLTTGATLTSSGEGVTFNALPAANNQIPLNQAVPPVQGRLPSQTAAKSTASGGVQAIRQASLPVYVSQAQQMERPPVAVSPSQPAVQTNHPLSGSATTREKKEWGFHFNPLNIVWLVLIFIIVLVILYTSKPNMVTNLENGIRVLNNNKLVLWTVIITIVIAVMAFAIMSMVSRRVDSK